MSHPDCKADRPALKPSEVYRPRLGAQRQPLSQKTMSELRAWREASAHGADSKQAGPTA